MVGQRLQSSNRTQTASGGNRVVGEINPHSARGPWRTGKAWKRELGNAPNSKQPPDKVDGPSLRCQTRNSVRRMTMAMAVATDMTSAVMLLR